MTVLDHYPRRYRMVLVVGPYVRGFILGVIGVEGEVWSEFELASELRWSRGTI